VGAGVTWSGEVAVQGRVRVDGVLVGTVRSPDLLEVSSTGRIEGEVHVAQALVGGTIAGRLVATERVTLLETARVEGELETPWLDVRPGARLDARVRVARG
jgi:cytoskeletal protein CcmA (bactofilin family)